MTPRWLQDASRWAVGALDDGDAMCSLQAVEFTARAGDVGSLLDGWERDRPGYAVICTGDPAASVDGVAVNLPATDFLELALFTGGPQVDDERLVRAIDELRQIARQLAPTVAYAFISVEPWFVTLTSPGHDTEWQDLMNGPQPRLAQRVYDEIVADAFPYQVLGVRHLQRLGGMPGGAVELSPARWEVAIGASEDWLFVEGYDPAPTYGRRNAESRRDPPRCRNGPERCWPGVSSPSTTHTTSRPRGWVRISPAAPELPSPARDERNHPPPRARTAAA